MKVHYVYHDYHDSALNFKFFLENFPIHQVDSVEVSACSFKCFDLTLIPKNIRVNYIDEDVDMFAHYKWLAKNTENSCNVLLINSSCIGPLCNIVMGDKFIEIINSMLCSYDLIAPVVEVPPDNFGAKSIDNYKFIAEDDISVPFAHSYCLFISSRGVLDIKKSKVLEKNYSGKHDAIYVCERQLTAVLLNEKRNILSLLKKHQGIDFTDKANWDYSKFSKNPSHTCPEGPNRYYESNIDPYEVVFYKNIRHAGAFRAEDRSGIPEIHREYIRRILLNQSLEDII